METMLEFDAEETQRTVSTGLGNAGHIVSWSGLLKQLPSQVEPFPADPLGCGTAQPIAKSVLQRAP